MVNKRQILIFPVGEGFLDELFFYKGQLIIKSVMAINDDGLQANCAIKKVMDYSELITTNAEDMDTVSQFMNTDYISSNPISNEDSNNSTLIKNLHTTIGYFLEENPDSYYVGPYHIHLKDSAVMTGSTHTEGSKDLYTKIMVNGKVEDKLYPTRNPSHIPLGTQIKMKSKKTRGR